MLVARFTMDEDRKMVSLHVKGHAGYADIGKDIVCSASSILAYTLAQEVKVAQTRGFLKYKPTLKLKGGDCIITCRAKDDESYNDILRTYLVIQTGYQLLAHNYHQYVAVELFGESE